MKNHILSFVDLETTGLDPLAHEIIEIGIVRARQTHDGEGRPRLEKISEDNIQLIPLHIENADPKGLEVNKYYKRDWSRALPQRAGLTRAVALLKDSVFVAQNVSSDWAFLLLACDRVGINIDNIVHYHKLDLASMVFGKMYDDDALFKFSLREMTVRFDVTNIDAHTALSDARATFEVCQKLLGGTVTP
jgi:DNA polymerase III epsilon subunit-like protein